MALRTRRDRFAPPPTAFEQQLIPVVSVMVASLAPLLPIVATAPVVPPLGFIALLSWRLLRNDLWPVWAALPLGLFDDLLSGAPIGTGMALWTITLLVIDAIDQRWVWRDHRQDWAIAVAGMALYLPIAMLMTGARAPLPVLLTQVGCSALLYPIISRLTAMLDRWRFGR